MSKFVKQSTIYLFRKSATSVEPDYTIVADNMCDALEAYRALEASDPWQVLIGVKVFLSV